MLRHAAFVVVELFDEEIDGGGAADFDLLVEAGALVQ
jgi:hypothetical protein